MAVPGEPRYVTACRCNAWRLCTWPAGAKGTARARWTVARCRSWRHAGECQDWRASVDWRRISDAFSKREQSDVVYLVLTLARYSSPNGPQENPLMRFADPAATWLALGPMLNRLRQRLGRLCCRETGCEQLVWRRRRRRKDGPNGAWKKGDEYGDLYSTLACSGECDALGGRYVAVVEQHNEKWTHNNWPHVNVLLHWPWLANRVRNSPKRIIPRRNGSEGVVLGLCDLLEHIVAAGFGYQSHASIAIHRDKLASYLVGAAKGVEKTAAEVAKRKQIPLAAPDGFRRVRAGRRFLEPVFKKEGTTGCLVSREGFHWQAVSRRQKDARIFVTDHAPMFRMHGPTIWIDARDWTVYLPDWPGWKSLERITDEGLAQWVLDLDLREPSRGPPGTRGPPRLHRVGASPPASTQ